VSEEEIAKFALEGGERYPYAEGFVVKDWADRAALAIAYDLCDRRGIKHEMRDVDNDVRLDLLAAHAAIIRAASKATGEPQP
jgi:hypothetical protein